MKLILILTLSILISGCASAPTSSSGPGLYKIPIGSTIKLNQPLTVPAGKVRAGVQYGKATFGVNQYEPYCEFHVNTILNKSVTLPAADYRVTKVRRHEIPIAGSQKNGGNMVASSSASSSWASLAAISAANDWLYTTSLYLESDAYPDIRLLECGNAFPAGFVFTHHITINEFEALAGDMMAIQAAGK
jgi:hypothetical protein